MAAFQFTRTPIAPDELRRALADPACGGYAAFEGWVRDSNEGQRVRGLEYEAFEALGVREGERIIAEAIARFGVAHAACVHRIGALAVGDDALTLAHAERLEGFVLESANALALVAVTHPALERGVTAAGRVRERAPQLIGGNRCAGELKCGHEYSLLSPRRPGV